jgi:predicted DNA-binding transcriptional regulator YafY
MPIKAHRIEKRLRNHIELIRKYPGISTEELRRRCPESVTLRTVQNDLKLLKRQWKGGRIVSRRGRHWVEFDTPVEELHLDTEKKIYLKLALEATEKMSDLSDPKEEIASELGLERVASPYYIKSEEFEEIDTDDELIRDLALAIREDHPVGFVYEEERFYVDPLRLVIFDGIWYLYGYDKEEVEDNRWKTWLLSGIAELEIEYSRRHDIPDEKAQEDLEEAPSPHFVPDRRVRVLLRVAEEAAELFTLKEHLPDQKILDREEDGSLRVEATVSVYEDLEREVKAWLPHIEILEPADYRERLIDELREYLAQKS